MDFKLEPNSTVTNDQQTHTKDADNTHYGVRRHRRSISQLMANMDELFEHERSARTNGPSGIVNPAAILDDEINYPYMYGQFDADMNVEMPERVVYGGERDSIDENGMYDDDVVQRRRHDDDDKDTHCLPEFQFSIIDSEYDETLAFPDSVTILSNVGDKPVLVERKDTTDEDEDEEEEEDCEEGCEDTKCSSRPAGGIPFDSIYGPSVKFNSFQRKVFIPGMEIQVRIIDMERNFTTHMLNPNLYTVQLTHGPFTWTIKRRYKHFNSLHQQLIFFRTSLNIPFPIRSHKEKRATMKKAAIQMADEAQLQEKKADGAQLKEKKADGAQLKEKKPEDVKSTASSSGCQWIKRKLSGEKDNDASHSNSSPPAKSPETTETHQKVKESADNNSNHLNASYNVVVSKKLHQRKKKRKLPRFPNRPESLVAVESLALRRQQLEDYLYNLLNITLYRNHHETLNFVEVSNVSFVDGLGVKGKEGAILKRTGSTRPGQAGCNFFGCFQQKCCVRCNYFCSDVLYGKWRNRWFFVKETCFGYIRPTDGVIRSVILFDQGFDVSTGIYQTGMRKGLQVITNNRHITLKCWTRRKCKEWMQYLKKTANSLARDFTYPNAHMSYAPVRAAVQATWFVDGCNYMAAVADALEAATEEIYIADWWLSPEIYMKRPAIDGDYWRLDRILHRKAVQGVRVFVLLFKEVEMALGINSYYSKQRLVGLHENVKVMRHPDHAKAGVVFWAHHEKIVVVDQTYAFLGGIDLCYGRWDDHRHRLTDLGSISTASASTGTVSKTGAGGGGFFSKEDTDSAFGSRKSSHIVTAEDFPQAHEEATVQLRRLAAGDKLIIPAVLHEPPSPLTLAERSAMESMKLNTPEMERKNMLGKLKENAMKKGKDLVTRLTMTDSSGVVVDGGEGNKTPEIEIDPKRLVYSPQELAEGQSQARAVPPEDPTPLQTHILNEFYGQAKLWYGKDYANFIMKDWMNLEAPLVDMIDRTTTPRMPWHDVGICVLGAAARDVARHFIQRWNAIKLEKCRDNNTFPYLMPKTYTAIKLNPNIAFTSENRVTCQLLRSVSSWSCGFIEQDLDEQSIHDAYIQTITKAQHYVYIENQFFITMQLGVSGAYGNVRNQIGETLYKRIYRAHKERKTFRVYVVMPLLPGFEGDVGGTTGTSVRAITHWNYASISRGRSAILTRLKESGIKDPSEYISFHCLRTHSQLNNLPITELIYVHSKLLIADDRVVICGSANINDRSMIGRRDSELAAIITDEEFEDGRMNGTKYPSGVFAGRLRKFLFREHLGLLQTDSERLNIDVTDPVSARFWHGLWRRISSRNTEIYDEVFKCIPNDFVKTFATLRKYQEEPPLSKTDPELAMKKISLIQGNIVNLPLDFLNQEVLTPPSTTKEGLIPTSVWT